MNKSLVIIPAKKDSKRLPNKNILPINDLPLFLYSCNYARDEGFKNIVVSSDSKEILSIAKEHGYETFNENVNESKLEYCFNQILEVYPDFDYFILLQPTSPLRKKGLLKESLIKLKYSPKDCLISVQKIKPVSFWGDMPMFELNNRPLAQDCVKWIYHYDGNILIKKILDYKKDNVLISTNCELVENEFPYYLQIDSKSEFDVLSQIITNK